MVGIPKSQGCHNCRRSRIKCDEHRPACRRCTTRGKECEGYDRYATFVNRTSNGVQKRTHLEETLRPPKRITDKLQSLVVPQPFVVPTDVVNVSSRLPKSQVFNNWPYQWLLDTFLRIYQPRNAANRNGCTIVWLREAASLTDPSPLLKTALHALAANRVAVARSDDCLAEEARRHCGDALRLLGGALDSYQTLCDDQTMAAARCLMIYELFESTTASVVAWGSHQKGLARICTLRGPQSFTSPLAMALLLDIKNVTMISNTQYSLPSSFGNPRWYHTEPAHTLWAIEHQVYDLAFRMCAVFQQEKKSTHKPDTDQSQLESLCDRLHGFARELDKLIQFPAEVRPVDCQDPGIRFWDLESALNVANALTLNLNASMRIYSLLTRLSAYGPLDAERLFLASTYTIERARQLTETIIDAVRYAIGDEMGLYGGQRSLYAVRMMICKVPRELPVFEQIRSLYRDLIDRKGIRHARDLDRVWGGIHEI